LYQRRAAFRDPTREVDEIAPARALGIDDGVKAQIDSHYITFARIHKVAPTLFFSFATILRPICLLQPAWAIFPVSRSIGLNFKAGRKAIRCVIVSPQAMAAVGKWFFGLTAATMAE